MIYWITYTVICAMDSEQKRFFSSSFKSLQYFMERFFILVVLASLADIFAVNGNKAPPPPGHADEVTISYKIQGRDAVLSCHIRDLGSRKVIWSRVADPYPIAIGKSRFNPDRKYRVTEVNDTYALTIRNIALDDAGEYMCRATGAVYVADVISLNIQTGPDTTHLIPTNTKIRASIGETVLLPCHVENLNDRVVLWRNSGNQVISLRKKNYNGDRRFKVIHNTRPEWSLRIQKIEESDFGYYICVVNANPVLTRTVHLINSAPPQSSPILKKDTHFKTKMEAMAGETVTLTCNFESNPPSKVNWYKQTEVNGKRVKEDLHARGTTYTLQSVKPEQSGVYLCYARNGVKPPGRGRTRLTVKEPPTTTTIATTTTTILPTGPTAAHVYAQVKVVSQKKGLSVELKCLAIGQPRPNIHWTRHQKRITNDHKYKVTTDTEGRYKYFSTLLIRSLISRDFGDYECFGHNILGLKSTTLTLKELK